jgi:cell division protein FtsI (penicillin-binding protein 3)
LAADGVFPLIQAGYYQDLKQVCDAMGVASLEAEGEDWVRTHVDRNTIQWVSNRAEGQNVTNHVPDVRGMTLRDALYLLENRGPVVIYKGVGRVKEQSQIPGARISRGNRIYLELG